MIQKCIHVRKNIDFMYEQVSDYESHVCPLNYACLIKQHEHYVYLRLQRKREGKIALNVETPSPSTSDPQVPFLEEKSKLQ